MKKIGIIVKQIIVLMIVYIFPVCTAIILEKIFSDNSEIVSNYLIVPFTLAGAVLALFVFRKEKIAEIKISSSFRTEYIAISGIGMSFKLIIIFFLHFIFSANITNVHKITILEFISAVILAPVNEEIVFRGILTDIIKSKYPETKLLNIFTILFTSVVWATSHLYGISVYTFLLIIDGIIIGIIYHKTNNLIVCITYHVANNFSVTMLNFLDEKYWIFSFIMCMGIFLVSVFCLLKNLSFNKNTVQ